MFLACVFECFGIRTSISFRFGFMAMSYSKLLILLSVSVCGLFFFPVIAFSAEGVLDSSFNGNGIVLKPVSFGTELALDGVVQPDGKLLVTGFSTSEVGSFDFTVLRYNIDGTQDEGFGLGGIVVTPLAYDDRA